MKIMQVSNYKVFASTLEARTGCSIRIKIMGQDHTHYELSKMGISLGILCIDKGTASFAPFVTHENAQDSQYISIKYFPMLEDFIQVLQTLFDLFTYDDDSKELGKKRDKTDQIY